MAETGVVFLFWAPKSVPLLCFGGKKEILTYLNQVPVSL